MFFYPLFFNVLSSKDIIYRQPKEKKNGLLVNCFNIDVITVQNTQVPPRRIDHFYCLRCAGKINH